MPVHTYMREYRVHVAADLLRQTNLSIAEISERVGYSNQSKFTEVFKRILNVSPIVIIVVLTGEKRTFQINAPFPGYAKLYSRKEIAPSRSDFFRNIG